MSRMNVNDIFTRVQRTFGDEASIQVTRADVIRWINDAQRELVMQHEGLLPAIATSSSTPILDFYSYPPDLFTLYKVYYRAASDDSLGYMPLRFMSPQAMDEYFGDWLDNAGSGTPQFYTLSGGGTSVKLYPSPDVGYTGAIRWIYSRYSIDVVSLDSDLDAPEYYHQAILEYCLGKAYEMDEDWESADRKFAYFQSTIDFNSHRETWYERQIYPSIVPTGDDYL